MNLHHLQYFYIVAQENGFSNAARRLNIQQPALSRTVAQLEQQLGFSLFDRIGKKISLTSRGQAVFAECRSIFERIDRLTHTAGLLKDECQGPLRIGTADSLASHFLPQRLAEFLAHFPKVQPTLVSAPASFICEQLLRGELDLALLFYVPPSLRDQVSQREVCRQRFHLVIRKDLLSDNRIRESFIGSREVDDGSTTEFPTLQRLRKIHPGAQIRISSNTLNSHREMVLAGLGVAILPEFLIHDDLRANRLSDLLPKEVFRFSIHLVIRKNARLDLNAREFLTILTAPARNPQTQAKLRPQTDPQT